jgi:hypothetical protein
MSMFKRMAAKIKRKYCLRGVGANNFLSLN